MSDMKTNREKIKREMVDMETMKLDEDKGLDLPSYSLHLSEQSRLYEHWKFLCARRCSDNRGSTVSRLVRFNGEKLGKHNSIAKTPFVFNAADQPRYVDLTSVENRHLCPTVDVIGYRI